MPVPTGSAMPDLSDLDGRVVANALLNWLSGTGFDDVQTSSYLTGYLRMNDKALREYEAARRALDAWVASRATGNRRFLELFRCIDHLETCINSCKRAYGYLDALRRHPLGPAIDHVLRRQIERGAEQIKGFRNAVEHMDEMIARGAVPQGRPVVLDIGEQGDRVSIADLTITFHDLAGHLRRLNTLAVELANYRPPSGNTGR